MNKTLLSLIMLAVSAGSLLAAPKLSLSEEGAVIDAGSAGQYLLPPPGLQLKADQYGGEKGVAELRDGALAVKYPSGAVLTMSTAGEELKFTFSGVPQGARCWVLDMHLPIRLNTGGKFILGDKAPQDFPLAKDKQILGDGGASSFSVIDPSGDGFKMILPADFCQVQDNRVFNWSVFVFMYYYNLAGREGQNSFTVKFQDLSDVEKKVVAGATTKAAPSVDKFGQSVRVDFPGKVRDEAELQADIAKQEQDLAKFQSKLKLDSYGGLADSGAQLKLKKTGFFHAQQADGRWFLVTPEGNAFFQLSVCGISDTDDYTTVKGREQIYEWLPKAGDKFDSAWREGKPSWGIFSFYIANWIRKFGKPYNNNEWTGQVVKRLRAWGFNSGGAFSLYTDNMRQANFPRVDFLPLGAGDGVKHLPQKIGASSILDPFVPGTEEALDKRFAEQVASRAKDPLLIGYFLSNEPHFEELPKKIPAYKASEVAAKGRLVQLLRDKYGSIDKFNTAWNPPQPFASFDELGEVPLFVRTDAGAADVREFYELYLDSYFSMVQRVFRKHDPNHLMIGSRLTPGTSNNEIAVRIAGKYTDVVSVNYYTYAIEPDFLKRVSDWSGDKPIILSEWYFGTTQEGLGGGKEVSDQAERGHAYRNYVEQSAALPFVVGSQWFIYGDQSLTGRFFEGFNGEGNNTGFVNVADRPYELLVKAAHESHERIYDVMLGKVKPYAYADARFNADVKGGGAKVVAVPRALPGMKLDGSTANWPGVPAEPLDSSRVMQGNLNEKLRGDFRLCWDDNNLYFLIHVKDATPGQNNMRAEALWIGDAVELFIGARDIGTGGTMLYSDRQIMMGAGKEPKLHIVDHPEDSAQCPLTVVPDVTGDGYTLTVQLPWKTLGIVPKAGMELLFDVAIDNSDDGQMRKQQLVWNGTAKNSTDRSAWGRARLVENER